MMDKTNRHFRYFLRQLSKQTLLYTEMITASAIIHGKREHLLDFDPLERPLVLQLGGNDPDEMAEAIRIAEDWDYDEYNLNVGCPSDRVQHRNFGASLMAEPARVSRILHAMHRAGTKPVSVKHRIGIEGKRVSLGSYEDMKHFVEQQEGAQRYVVHARVAILEGLSPKENRHVPPLRYADVYRLKEEMPQLHIEVNGGIRSHEEIAQHLKYCDGVMLGRLAYERPWLFAQMDHRYYAQRNAGGNIPQEGELANPSRRQVIEAWFRYIEQWVERGLNVRSLTWPVLELFAGEAGSRKWKQALSGSIPTNLPTKDFLSQCMEAAPRTLLDQPAMEYT